MINIIALFVFVYIWSLEFPYPNVPEANGFARVPMGLQSQGPETMLFYMWQTDKLCGAQYSCVVLYKNIV